MNGTNKSFPPNKERFHPKEFRVKYSTSQPPEFSGKNMLFHYRTSYYLLSDDNIVITNNNRLRRFTFYSNKSRPNRKFVISSFISGIFKFLNLHRLPESIKKKYFTCIRRHLLITAAAVKTRLSSIASNNNQTRTFFRFSVGRNTYYFGIYVPCQHACCPIPPTHVTKRGARCWRHWKDLCRQLTPLSPLHFPEFPTKPKRVQSLRLGISYVKDLVYNSAAHTYLVIHRDLRRFSSKPQCLRQFERLTCSPASNNRAFLLYEENRTVFHRCHHLPSDPLELDLTRFVRDHPDLVPDDVLSELDLYQFVLSHPTLI